MTVGTFYATHTALPSLSEADQKFVQLAQKLIVQYNLGIGNRVGLVYISRNIGDVYFFCSSISYAQCILNKHYVVITRQGCTVDIFLNWHNANGANIEKVYLSNDDCEICNTCSEQIKTIYAGTLDFFRLRYENSRMFNGTSKIDVYQNLTRPKISKINIHKYIDQFGLVPGKTVFVIPESGWMGSLPLYFWTMSIQLLKLLGYHIIVNSKNRIYGNDVICCVPPLDDIIDLCNQCGLVYTIRTGLAELIACETTAKMFIFGIKARRKYDTLRHISLIYPFIDNSDNHIVEIILPEDKENFSWIKNAQDHLQQITAPLYTNIKLRDSIQLFNNHNEYVTALLSSYIYLPNIRLFTDRPAFRCNNFCNVEYSFYTKNDLIYLTMRIKPNRKFIIHLALKIKSTNKIVEMYQNYNCKNAIFQVKDDNEYYAVVHLIDSGTKQSAIFETHSIIFKCQLKYKLKYSTDYYQYIKMLYELLNQNILIFIVSKDAHVNPSKTRKLELKQFNFVSNLEQMYRYSWLAIIDNGKIIKEMSSPDQEVHIEYQWDGNQAYLSSSGWNVNRNPTTPISICINGEEQAVDLRGLNFVIWDKEENQLLDSVCFDTYLDSLQAYRP